jgi:hypothetical protein
MVILLAVLVGAGSLLLPVPDTVEVAKFEPPPAPVAPKAPPSKDRQARRKLKPDPKPAPVVPKPFPMQDTTKTRTMIPQKK